MFLLGPTPPSRSDQRARLCPRVLLAALAAVAICLLAPALADSAPPAHSAASCADYQNQAAAQRAKDTRDADGDGIYCESLPCPCLKPGADPKPSPPTRKPRARSSCTKPRGIARISFSGTKYPTIRQHTLAAIGRGWPRTLVLNRPGASARRERLLQGVPTKAGFDRDEYPPAVGRGRGRGLTRGSHPTGWMADVDYVPSAENRSHGSSLGTKLRRFCNGTRFRYVFF